MNQVLLYRLNRQHEQIFESIKSCDGDFLNKKHITGKWSIREHLAHLGRYQEVFMCRIQQTLVDESARTERYSAEKDPGFEKWLEKDIPQIIRDIQIKRKALANLIRELNKEELSRTLTHPKFGAMSVEEWTEFFVLHESHHAYSIFRIIHRFQ